MAGWRAARRPRPALPSQLRPARPPPGWTSARRHQALELPQDNPPLAWYLCALPNPWNWSQNAHLAFEGAPGEEWEGPALVPGLHVQLTNARPITGWGEHDIPDSEPRRKSVRFRTCRNYQFAWWLRVQRNAPDAPPEKRAVQAARPG
ncbi:hypothetical protein GCM10020295_56520 [Streptomyces cinereospinus]